MADMDFSMRLKKNQVAPVIYPDRCWSRQAVNVTKHNEEKTWKQKESHR